MTWILIRHENKIQTEVEHYFLQLDALQDIGSSLCKGVAQVAYLKATPVRVRYACVCHP